MVLRQSTIQWVSAKLKELIGMWGAGATPWHPTHSLPFALAEAGAKGSSWAVDGKYKLIFLFLQISTKHWSQFHGMTLQWGCLQVTLGMYGFLSKAGQCYSWLQMKGVVPALKSATDPANACCSEKCKKKQFGRKVKHYVSALSGYSSLAGPHCQVKIEQL